MIMRIHERDKEIVADNFIVKAFRKTKSRERRNFDTTSESEFDMEGYNAEMNEFDVVPVDNYKV